MKKNVDYSYHEGHKTFICGIRFMDADMIHIVRCARLSKDAELRWELRYFNSNIDYDDIEIDEKLSRVLDMNTEEELFQASCVEKFDVYLVKAAMNEILRRIAQNDLVITAISTEIILEY